VTHIGDSIVFTAHAIARAQERGISLAEAARAVTDFESVSPGACWGPLAREVRTRGGVSTVYEPHRRLVLTIWKEASQPHKASRDALMPRRCTRRSSRPSALPGSDREKPQSRETQS